MVNQLLLRIQMTEVSTPDEWLVYILKCGDGSYYTGITKDLDKRIEEHRSGKGAKYLRGRGPLEIIFSKNADSHGAALKYEIKIKKLSKQEKTKLILNPTRFDKL